MSLQHLEIELSGETLYLLPQKAVYRPALRQLILSDLHLGKTSHFRKKGIALPQQGLLRDLDTLNFLLNTWKPQTVLLLGDLFHSHYNREWLWFKALLMEHPHVQFILVEGNHDILDDKHYALKNLVKTELLEDAHFIFSHHPLEDAGKINFCGHLHPGFRIYGMARQAEKLPCFYFNGAHFILPAFGHLTGLYILDKEEKSCYYLVTGTRVIAYS